MAELSWRIAQEARIRELEARLKAATERCDAVLQWVNTQIEGIRRSSRPPEAEGALAAYRQVHLRLASMAADLALLDGTPEHPDVIDVEDIGTPEAIQ